MQRSVIITFRRSLFLCSALLLGTATTTLATLIDFETFTGPSLFSAAGPAQTLNIPTSIGNVTVSGGVVLRNATFSPSNQTSLYATANNVTQFGIPNDATRLNPITVTFPVPINNFFLDVINGLPSTTSYQVADNAGNSRSFSLPTTLQFGGFTQIGFAAAGSVVTVGSTSGLPAWDFAIDNIRFNEPLPPNLTEPGAGNGSSNGNGNVPAVPEPTTVMLLGTGLMGIALTRRAMRISRNQQD